MLHAKGLLGTAISVSWRPFSRIIRVHVSETDQTVSLRAKVRGRPVKTGDRIMLLNSETVPRPIVSYGGYIGYRSLYARFDENRLVEGSGRAVWHGNEIDTSLVDSHLISAGDWFIFAKDETEFSILLLMSSFSDEGTPFYG